MQDKLRKKFLEIEFSCLLCGLKQITFFGSFDKEKSIICVKLTVKTLVTNKAATYANQLPMQFSKNGTKYK